MTIHVEIDTNQTLTTTSEAVVLTANTYESYQNEFQGEPTAVPTPAVVKVVVDNTPGTGATTLQIRLRHGVNALAGTLVGNVVTVAPQGGTLEFLDPVGDLQGYTVTAQQVGATGNGTVTSVAMDIDIQ